MHGLINFNHTKTKCRLCWCLIEYINWRFSTQFCWYCPSILISWSPPPPLPKSQSTSILYRSLTSVSDQIQNLQNCLTTPNKNLGVEGTSDRCTFGIAFYQSNLSTMPSLDDANIGPNNVSGWICVFISWRAGESWGCRAGHVTVSVEDRSKRLLIDVDPLFTTKKFVFCFIFYLK
jgi:hypothetical protein